MSPPTLITLPGMGTTAPLLEPQRQAFPTLHTPDWLPARTSEPLADYARRLLHTLDTSQPFYLAGVSFGGMVAMEMARHCDPKAVFLIASARSGRQIPATFRASARLGPRLPTWALALVPRPLLRLHFAWREGLTAEHRRILARAVAGADRKLFYWTGDAIARWQGSPAPPCPVYHVHGARDWIVKPPPPGPGVELIEHGRHMINLTHAQAVNSFIRRHAPDLPYREHTDPPPG